MGGCEERRAEIGAARLDVARRRSSSPSTKIRPGRPGEAEPDRAGLRRGRSGGAARSPRPPRSGRRRRSRRARSRSGPRRTARCRPRRGTGHPGAGLAGDRVGHAGAAAARRRPPGRPRRPSSVTSAPGRAARRPSSGETMDSGSTVALPPPWVRACRGVVADDGDRRSAEASQRQLAAVLQQHRALGRGLPGEARCRPRRDRARPAPSPSSAPTRGGEAASMPQHLAVDDGLLDLARRGRPRPARRPTGPSGPGMTRSCEASARSPGCAPRSSR